MKYFRPVLGQSWTSGKIGRVVLTEMRANMFAATLIKTLSMPFKVIPNASKTKCTEKCLCTTLTTRQPICDVQNSPLSELRPVFTYNLIGDFTCFTFSRDGHTNFHVYRCKYDDQF
eukprot:6209402-Pleurochrysis_carterae.AAC.2